jgi:hypothetical protein
LLVLSVRHNQQGQLLGLPAQIDLEYSYTGFAQSQGDNSFPGAQLDNDLFNLIGTINEGSAFLAAAFNSNGTLKAASIPDLADVTAFVSTATAAAASASASAITAGNAAAAVAIADLGLYLLKSDNLNSVTDKPTARSNLGLGALAIKSSVGTADIEDGSVTHTEVAAGAVVQFVSSVTGSATTVTDQVPLDDTIPQNDEGTEITNAVITPKSITNRLIVRAGMVCSVSTAMHVIGHISRNSTAGSVAAALTYVGAASQYVRLTLEVNVGADSLSAQTFRLFVGGSAPGSVYVNGTSGGRQLGGVANTYITITEVKA